METTQDLLLGGAIKLYQPLTGYRFGIDAVLLAASVVAKENQKILDVGTGVGVVLLCIGSRLQDCQLTGLEIQHELVELASKNIQLNHMQGRACIIQGTVQNPPQEIQPNSFDHVVTNPPYMADEISEVSPYVLKAISHHGSEVTLEEWLKFCTKMLKPKGLLTLIHRADRLPKLLSLISKSFGEIVVLPLWSKTDKPAKRIIIRAKKRARTPLCLLPGLVLHNEDGTYTTGVNQILRTPTAMQF
ncbi:MAG: methyltransferase [Pseudomonadota bacterium]